MTTQPLFVPINRQPKLKNKYGGREVTDPQGNSWVEIDLKPEYKKMPIEAFGILGGVGLGVSQKDNGGRKIDFAQ